MNVRAWLFSLALLAGCGSLPEPAKVSPRETAPRASEQARDVVFTALSLMETGYKFGGKNPEAGLDCSGMVNYVFRAAVQRTLGASAADMARQGRPVVLAEAQPGDLVFFNTQNAPHSHVGIYLGDARFIHAPSSKGKVRIDRVDLGWFAPRLTEVRRYLD